MQCAEVKEHLTDLNRGRLDPETAKAIRTHVEGCVACAADLQTEAEIRALIRGQAPRYTAPPGLRARIQANMTRPATRGSSVWLGWLRAHTWASGLAGAVAAVLLVWSGSLWLAGDPLSRMLTHAVTEHAEYVQHMMSRPASDPQSLLGELRSQAGFSFEPVFQGDPGVQLVGTQINDLSGKRTATLIYRDSAGRYTTLFLMPGTGTVIPDGGRMQIESFKPYHRVTSGRQVLLWKQRELACIIVSDLDQSGLASMFLKIRKAT
ncbi:MAG TPA: zf-HC2 domain-containing protein, partial [Candidatus Methylomirabilis sp.]|nr:zf-HC2 domain-containing protein [Candidatus Methylomirabilis sp.]HSB81290.1 zf-HC2 domain-containing protein [Candidatus Methylomirabilis sp.]